MGACAPLLPSIDSLLHIHMEFNFASFKEKNRIRPVVTSKTKINQQKLEKEEIRSISEFELGTKAEHTCVEANSTGYFVFTRNRKSHPKTKVSFCYL